MVMLNKEEFIASVLDEFRIIKHLFTKIPEGKLDYKPTEKQRNTLEVLQYLSIMPLAMAEAIRKGGFGDFMAREQASKSLKAQEFEAAMDKQAGELRSLIESMTDEELNGMIDLMGSGASTPRRVLLVDWLLKNLGAYKMQLFLYIKASGNESIGTWNLWGGMDMPQKGQ